MRGNWTFEFLPSPWWNRTKEETSLVVCNFACQRAEKSYGLNLGWGFDQEDPLRPYPRRTKTRRLFTEDVATNFCFSFCGFFLNFQVRTPYPPLENKYCSAKVDQRGVVRWTNPKSQPHRVDGNGIQDGPAVIYPEGFQFWFLNGKMHRLDGPAWIHPDGSQRWYLDGVQMSQEEWAQDPRVIEHHSQTQLGAEQWLTHL